MVNLELMYYKDEDSIEFDNHHDIYIFSIEKFRKIHPLEELPREQIDAAIKKTLDDCKDKEKE